MKFAGTVVLYNPEENLIENINTYLPFLDVLYVMDNSTKQLDIIEEVKKIEKIRYISLDGNKGIAKALKIATETALEEGYDFLLSMDQDSKFPTEDFHYIKDYIENNDMSKVGIVAINYNVYTEKVYKNNTDNKDENIDVKELITSGSFVNLNAYKNIDGYNEDLFIDLVDNDICYQFKVIGYELKLFTNIFLLHKLGELQEVRFLWKKMKATVHSPLRYYYMYRNYYYLLHHRSHEYVKLLKSIESEFSFKVIIEKFRYIKPRFKNLKMILKGIKHGKKGILGPYQEKKKK